MKLQEARPDLTLYLVDIDLSHADVPGARLEMPSLEAAKLVPDDFFDFVFLDADHSYAAVKADIAAWRPKVEPGGWLCGHDYGKVQYGVTEAVDELGAVEIDADHTWFVKV